ncbi:hypothetical protein GOP47_0009453 [Adiantum capillus-veneris]|uniref:Uncharacterized protein n=1 Tax=Adiantum capillus-veneris TaxID=13818 RepID=A0A9D4UX47_ADICA|nr:hypothetical protein GOP47_0009453 [Adiantum capillus-veneris]
MESIKADRTNGADAPCTSRVMGPCGSTFEPHKDQRVHEGQSKRCHRRLNRDGADSIGKIDGPCRVRRWDGVGIW